MNKSYLSAACVAIALSAGAANAALISFAETGDGVVMSLSGVLNLPGEASTRYETYNRSIYVAPSLGSLSTDLWIVPQEVLGGGNYVPRHYALSGPRSFGTGGLNETGTRTPGSTTALSMNILDLGGTPLFSEFVFSIDVNFVSGSELRGSVTFAGATIASLGLTPGDYDYTLGLFSAPPQTVFQASPPQTVSQASFDAPAPSGFRISIEAPAVIPLPPTAALLLGALGLGALFRRRKSTA